ncbi:N-acetylmuramoyl-L-alanine amidase [Pyxidicoccus fallax]|uniref:N-acetylmuramoyl-L-alanine amidase n=1 Tax=Pyxidicoccus fallax TaxID=394095 RepID=A0A848L410_9BACT|nr:N-acetylmuramoyl-L-alanine amidase [Pyxidicoccus fallax]NMO13690.1 N-acetylmuramoyl-L-alanine amidase [Pyxidicoccus fallax]NPC76822.1 N-acetylmuramoyl-L-alanine amidase [Pyxidicoccus fallax]
MRLALVLPLLLLLAPSTVGAAKRNEAEEAYQGARRAYYALKDDAARRKLRHHWLNVVRKFEAVASHHPKSARAPDALFTAAELLQELSRVSFVEEDLKAAIAHYNKLLSAHPRHKLADDAALALARIQVNRLDQPDAARRTLTEALAAHSKGDQARNMKELLATLPAPKSAPAQKPAPASKATAVAQAERPNSSLVDAIEKLAREPSPMIPRLDPNAPARARAEPEAQEKGLDAAVAAALAAKEAKTPESKRPSDEEAAARDAKSPGDEPAAVAAAPKKPADVEPAREPKPADVKPEAPKSPATDVAVAAAEKSEPKTKAAEAPFEITVAAPEPPKPITRPVDDRVAQARLKAVAKQSKSAELTLAEQLGLKVRRVIIDPGHGGHDTGAIGKGGTREKDVALTVSKKLAEQLREKGLEVVLTRDDDRFIRLEDRAKFANAEHGDLFISVHCNAAASRKLRGVETYTLNTSADRYSIRLAARENASSEKGISDLQFILADLATKANTEESSRLANQVQRALVTGLSRKYSGIKDLGHKEALFYVLLGVKMPAILVETSFLSNPEEEERLASGEYQAELAKAIAHGVEEFIGDRRRVAKVD